MNTEPRKPETKAAPTPYTPDQTFFLNRKTSIVLPCSWMVYIVFSTVFSAIRTLFNLGNMPSGMIVSVLLSMAISLVTMVGWVIGLQKAWDGAKKSQPKLFADAAKIFAILLVVSVIHFVRGLLVGQTVLSALLGIVDIVMTVLALNHCNQAKDRVVERTEEELAQAEGTSAPNAAAGTASPAPAAGKTIITFDKLGGIVMGVSAVLVLIGCFVSGLSFLAILGMLAFMLGFIFLKMGDTAIKTSGRVGTTTVTKKKVLVWIVALVLITGVIVLALGSSGGSKSYKKPNSSHGSVSEYIQDADPGLWDDMQRRWDSLGN